MHHIAVFSSGTGTNCENLIRSFNNSEKIKISVVITNNPFAGVIERANRLGVDCYINLFKSEQDFETLLNILKKYKVSWIILAGFIKMIPKSIIEKFTARIINIHPALLPKFGGKGMYGNNVHKTVIEAKEKESGITIHIVNEKYDEGEIIAQYKCEVLSDDTPETLANRIHILEYKYFPSAVENFILKNATF